MAKTLNKMLGIGAIAATAMFGGSKEANANTLISVTTTVSPVGVDQDLNRDGIQNRYDWKVENLNGQTNGIDSIFQYVIKANLEESRMYGFTNTGNAWSHNQDYANNFHGLQIYQIVLQFVQVLQRLFQHL